MALTAPCLCMKNSASCKNYIALYRMCMWDAAKVLYYSIWLYAVADAWPALASILSLQVNECTDFPEQVKVGVDVHLCTALLVAMLVTRRMMLSNVGLDDGKSPYPELGSFFPLPSFPALPNCYYYLISFICDLLCININDLSFSLFLL